MILAELLFLAALQMSASGGEAEDELILRIRLGDHEAFKTFFDLHASRLLSFLMSKGLERDTAEDIVQQAFMAVWEKRSGLDPSRSGRAYLFTIAYNRMLNHIRDNRTNTELQFAYELADESEADPHRRAESSDAMRVMQSALSTMPEQRRRVFELCYLQQLTYKEAASALQVSVKTIENHMTLALRDLRAALRNFLPDH